MKVESKILYYRGEKILFTGGFYWYNASYFKTLKGAKKCIDAYMSAKLNGLT
jgi:peptide methionine sulfoxide reductase MsrA